VPTYIWVKGDDSIRQWLVHCVGIDSSVRLLAHADDIQDKTHWIECHSDGNIQSVFPEEQSQLSQLHASFTDAYVYLCERVNPVEIGLSLIAEDFSKNVVECAA
jgi:hypothetical protein